MDFRHPAPRMDVVKQIEELIVGGTDDFFEDPGIRMDLHVTIRIACEFHEFLSQLGETPTVDEVTYVIDTIRSGMDQFFFLAFTYRSLSDDFAKWDFERQVSPTFPDFRKTCLCRFEELSRPEASAAQCLASLLAFVQFELAFLTQNFPSFVTDQFPCRG